MALQAFAAGGAPLPAPAPAPLPLLPGSSPAPLPAAPPPDAAQPLTPGVLWGTPGTGGHEAPAPGPAPFNLNGACASRATPVQQMASFQQGGRVPFLPSRTPALPCMGAAGMLCCWILAAAQWKHQNECTNRPPIPTTPCPRKLALTGWWGCHRPSAHSASRLRQRCPALASCPPGLPPTSGALCARGLTSTGDTAACTAASGTASATAAAGGAQLCRLGRA